MSIADTAGGAERVPALRFPEFEGAWEEKRLDALLHSHKLGGNYSNSLEPTEWPLIKMGNLKRGKMDVGKIEYVEIGEEIDADDKINRGDLFFNTRNTLDLVGKVAIWNDELPVAYFNSNLMRLMFDCNEFMNLRLNSHTGVKSLKRIAAGTTSVAAIYTKDLLAVKTVTPSLPEQKKIAAFLGVVDAKISGLKARQEGLERYKRGLMQALFSQRLRFTKPDGTGFPDWEEKRLGEVFSEVTEKVGEQDLRTFSISAGKGWVSQEEKFGKDISGQQNAKYTALKVGDFSYNKGNSKSYKYGCIYPNETGETIGVPNVFISFRANSSQTVAGFYGSLFENHHLDWGLRRLISSGARMDGLLNVNKVEFFKLMVPEPHPNEQQKIADALQAMDAKIAAVAGQVAKMEEFKKGLLQQMFV